MSGTWSSLSYDRAHEPMGAERARPARAGRAGAVRRARLRADDGGRDRRAGGAHRAHVLPALRRQARGAVRRAAPTLQEIFVEHLADAPASAAPIEAVAASPRGRRSAMLQEPSRAFARRRQAVIVANAGAAGTRADQARDARRRAGRRPCASGASPDPAASLAAEAGIAVFKVAFERWVAEPASNVRSSSSSWTRCRSCEP